MVVDPTILPEKLAPLLLMIVSVAQTRKQLGYTVSDGQPRGTTKGAGFVMVDQLERLVAM